MAKIKKWHIASAVAIIAILALIVVLASRRGSRLEAPTRQCPPVQPGDPLTSYTQNASNCTVTCMTTDTNATAAYEPGGACRSTCTSGFVKSAVTGACTISSQMANATIDNMKLELMNLTDPTIKRQMTAQIASMEAQLSQKSSQPMSR